jgi:phosphate transport system protein
LLAQAHSDQASLEAILAWLDVTHILERLADRATNIGERVIFMATNLTEELNT